MGEAGSRRGRRFVRDKKSSLANKFSPFFSLFFFFFFTAVNFPRDYADVTGKNNIYGSWNFSL